MEWNRPKRSSCALVQTSQTAQTRVAPVEVERMETSGRAGKVEVGRWVDRAATTASRVATAARMEANQEGNA